MTYHWDEHGLTLRLDYDEVSDTGWTYGCAIPFGLIVAETKRSTSRKGRAIPVTPYEPPRRVLQEASDA